MKSDIQFAMHSYLAWRQKGMPEPRPGEPIRFLKKAMVEQELILAATGEGERNPFSGSTMSRPSRKAASDDAAFRVQRRANFVCVE